MRSYDHPVDQDFVLQRLSQELEGPAGPAGPGRQVEPFDVVVGDAITAVGLGWAAGEPSQRVRARLARALVWIREALDRGESLLAGDASRWIEIALVAGDDDTAQRVATMVRKGRVAMNDVPTVPRWHLHALLALLRRDRRTAKEAAGAMRQWIHDPATENRTVDDYTGVDALLTAVAGGDQARLDSALAARRRHVVEAHSRTADQQRWVSGLIDLRAAAIAAIARRDGLVLPEGDPYVATDLVTSNRDLGVIVKPRSRRRVIVATA